MAARESSAPANRLVGGRARAGVAPAPRASIGDRLERAAGPLDQPTHAQLRVGQQARAVLVQRDAALVEHDRLLERLAAGLELRDGRLSSARAAIEAQATLRPTAAAVAARPVIGGTRAPRRSGSRAACPTARSAAPASIPTRIAPAARPPRRRPARPRSRSAELHQDVRRAVAAHLASCDPDPKRDRRAGASAGSRTIAPSSARRTIA